MPSSHHISLIAISVWQSQLKCTYSLGITYGGLCRQHVSIVVFGWNCNNELLLIAPATYKRLGSISIAEHNGRESITARRSFFYSTMSKFDDWRSYFCQLLIRNTMKNLLSRRRVSHAPGAGVVIHIVQKQAGEKVRLILFLCLSLCRKAVCLAD